MFRLNVTEQPTTIPKCSNFDNNNIKNQAAFSNLVSSDHVITVKNIQLRETINFKLLDVHVSRATVNNNKYLIPTTYFTLTIRK